MFACTQALRYSHKTGISLGKRLRTFRRKHGWTRAQVSERTGGSVSTLSKLENGRPSRSFSSVLRLAEGLQLPVACVIGPGSSAEFLGRLLDVLAGSPPQVFDGQYRVELDSCVEGL